MWCVCTYTYTCTCVFASFWVYLYVQMHIHVVLHTHIHLYYIHMKVKAEFLYHWGELSRWSQSSRIQAGLGSQLTQACLVSSSLLGLQVTVMPPGHWVRSRDPEQKVRYALHPQSPPKCIFNYLFLESSASHNLHAVLPDGFSATLPKDLLRSGWQNTVL